MIWADGFNLRLIFIVFSMASLLAVGFNLQLKGPKGRRPRGLQGGRAAADPASLLAQGRADLRALQGPGRRRRQAPKKNSPKTKNCFGAAS